MVTRPLKVERRTVSVRRPKTGVPPTVLRNQPLWYCVFISRSSSSLAAAATSSLLKVVSTQIIHKSRTVYIQPEHVSGTENGAERAENRMEQSGAWSGRERKRWSVSGARSGRSRSGNGAESGITKIGWRVERRFFRSTLRSHASAYNIHVCIIKLLLKSLLRLSTSCLSWRLVLCDSTVDLFCQGAAMIKHGLD